jgi:DNA polymerase I-like protein with 3'-5' exonuclease and polymerase domains
MKVAVIHETTIPHGGAGSAYDLVSRMLRACGVGAKDYDFIYMGKMGQKFTKVDDYMPFHSEVVQSGELGEYDKILCLGGVPLSAVLGSPRGLSIQKYRGRGYTAPTGQFTVATYSPFTVFKDWDYFRDFANDIYKLVTHDEVMPGPNDFEHDWNMNDLDYLKYLLDEARVVSCDIETLGFDFFANGDEILTVAFCALAPDGSGCGTILTADFLRDHYEVFDWMEARVGPIVFHNAKFDVQHLSNFLGRELLLYDNCEDTMLMHYALDERPSNRYKVHGLKMLSRVYFDAPDYEIAMGPWIKEYTENDDSPSHRQEMMEELCEYQFLDTWYTARLRDALEAERYSRSGTEPEDVHRFVHDTLMPATLALAEIERHGVPVRAQYFKDMLVRIELVLIDELATLQEQVRIITDGEITEFNPNSPKQVKKVIYEHAGCVVPQGGAVGRYAYKNKGKQTTDKDVLKVLASIAKKEGRELVALCLQSILSYRQKSKVLGTYVKGMIERCGVVDEKGWSIIHATFFTAGTSTARLSCANPNLQNIPDASHVGEDVRSGFAAPDGYVMLEADYSQLELRVAGLFSRDEALLDVYRDGRDIHQEVAYNLWQKPKDEVTKYERYLAKCLNFGLVYGRGPRSIATGPEMDMLENMRGARWSPKEVEAYYNKFLRGFPRLVEWMGEMKIHVRKEYNVSTPFGNYRRFQFIPDGEWHRVERQAVNTPIQGFASLMCTDALRRIHCRLRDEGINARILFTVHDSILILVEEDDHIIHQVQKIVLWEMENNLPPLPGVDWDMLPFKAEIELKRTWGGKEDEALTEALHASVAA